MKVSLQNVKYISSILLFLLRYPRLDPQETIQNILAKIGCNLQNLNSQTPRRQSQVNSLVEEVCENDSHSCLLVTFKS